MRILFSLVALCCMLLLTGCPYESNIPISKVQIPIDSNLIGQWYITDVPTTQDTLLYQIAAFNQQEYFLLGTEISQTGERQQYYVRAFTSEIADHHILNLHDFMDKGTYLYADYKIQDGQLIVRCLNADFFTDKPTDIAGMQQTIEANIDTDGFLEDALVFKPYPAH